MIEKYLEKKRTFYRFSPDNILTNEGMTDYWLEDETPFEGTPDITEAPYYPPELFEEGALEAIWTEEDMMDAVSKITARVILESVHLGNPFGDDDMNVFRQNLINKKIAKDYFTTSYNYAVEGMKLVVERKATFSKVIKKIWYIEHNEA